MQLLFYLVIFGFIVFLNIGLYLPTIFSVATEDIDKNTKQLKKQKWFKDLLKREEYKHLVSYDKDVRNTIGRFNQKKIEKSYLQGKYERKLQSILQEKLDNPYA